ncbi:hypothetical protein ACFCYM_07230 [Streptomyces sp. NPDC056254]|uniref:hypothetical protein n=1 Tax=Streptomyces sp. NPDC056254 TaxID=3345763 RepID=UPI0035E231DA
MPDRSPDSPPDQRPDDTPDGGRRTSLWLWSLLGLFAACVPCALLVVEKLGSTLSPVPLVLTVLAALAGYVLAVRAVVGEWFGQRPRRSRILVWSAATVLFLGSVAVLLVLRPPPPPLSRMSGARDVAVAGFAAGNGRQDRQVLNDVAASFAHDMATRLPTATAVRSYADQTPLPLARLAHTSRGALERKTAQFADETNAEIVVGGLVSEDQAGQTTLRPAVYIRADQIPDSPELTGWFLGEPILIARGWESARARAQLTGELTRRIEALTQFIDALDAWRNGSPADAGRILTGLLDAEQRHHASGFVPPDQVRLFHGHVLEEQANSESGPARAELLEKARRNYLAIGRDSAVGRRATLSLQGNAYRRAIGPAPCPTAWSPSARHGMPLAPDREPHASAGMSPASIRDRLDITAAVRRVQSPCAARRRSIWRRTGASGTRGYGSAPAALRSVMHTPTRVTMRSMTSAGPVEPASVMVIRMRRVSSGKPAVSRSS